MVESSVDTSPSPRKQQGVRSVLNVGCGNHSPESLHPAFQAPGWKEVRLDINPNVRPDVVGSVVDMSSVSDDNFDAIWCSHNLEHLHSHEIKRAVAEFLRVLKPEGFALITCPDLEAIAELVVGGRTEDVAYTSPAGPITALDMLYGHSDSIAKGNSFMAHKTGFTADRLGRMLADGGFAEALVIKGRCFDLWALALKQTTDKSKLLADLQAHSLNFVSDGECADA
jgi:predicted SAM-dependent methyltransferase